ncbi:uncharacterized protein LOC106774402 isoform X2 [Vigna radiata var. radiata]|uniref:Uncharacterized protein LOC106774402 isoform X2 n=1 Tax=Vigna radiata var. radiata TaxID=3916 RepID=A0A3Q0FKH0_VIGRR|nr:uncharacterized protein LOC106774402 isoform X2 [Vigna radiata var. radiata]
MEIFYLLCSIVSTSLTSLLLSLILAFNTLLRRRESARAASSLSRDEVESVSLYEGTVWHQRRHPVNHSFQYRVRYAFIDLDCASHAPRDHISPDEARQITDTNGPIFLLTIPPSVGYEQNPLSVYYCYAVEGSTKRLKKCIAEVTNTPWGERVSFVFDPHSDLVAKALHVSPFMLQMMLPVEVPEKDQVTLYHSLLYTTVVYMVCLPCSCHTSDLLWGHARKLEYQSK